MPTRFILAPLLMLVACGDPDRATGDALNAADDERIDCAVEGAASFERVCTLERVTSPAGTILVIRHPSGGFRRLLVAADGRGVIAADGAEPARVAILAGDEIEVALAGDRYRLPAAV